MSPAILASSILASVGFFAIAVGLFKAEERKGDYDLMPDPAGCLSVLVGAGLLLVAAGIMVGRLL